jgi:G3E family GTPase
MVFRARKPFHPQRFWEWLHDIFPPNIIRSKGMFWLASRPDNAFSFSQAGGSSRLDVAGVWWGSMSFAERIRYTDYVENQKYIEGKWVKDWDDRIIELVFIGQGLHKEQIANELENCLINDHEVHHFFSDGKFHDPFIEIF